MKKRMIPKSIKEATFILPVVPEPPEGEAAIFIGTNGFMGPFMRGDGPISLRCGRCMLLLIDHMHPGQLANLILKCPKPNCGAYNALISIPTIENLVEQLQNTSLISAAEFPVLAQILEDVRKQRKSKEQLFTEIKQNMPEFSWIERMIIPQNPGEFYGFLSFLIALLAWYQARKPSSEESVSTITRNFLKAQKS